MDDCWQRYVKRLIDRERNRQAVRDWLSRFWIWLPYSKYSLSEQELRDRGFENLNERNNQ